MSAFDSAINSNGTSRGRYIPPHLRGTSQPSQGSVIPRLTASNLSGIKTVYNSSVPIRRRDRDDDEDLETTSILSRFHYTGNMNSSNHGMRRMKEREISIQEVSKAVKHGLKTSLADKTTFHYHDLVVVLGSRNAENLETLSEETIASRVRVETDMRRTGLGSNTDGSFTLVTVYRDDLISESGITGEEYWLWRKLLLCICSKDEHNLTVTKNRASLGYVDDPSVEFTRLFEDIRARYASTPETSTRFTRILNWRVAHNRLEPVFRRTRQCTLLAAAAIRGYGRIVRLLLDNGANPGIVCHWNEKGSHGNALSFLFRSIDKSFWVPSVVTEDIAMIIAEHPHTDRKVFEEQTRGYPLLHRAIHRGARRLVEHIVHFRAYPGMLEIVNKYNENAITLASLHWMDLALFSSAGVVTLTPPLRIQNLLFIPNGYTVLPTGIPDLETTVKFRMAFSVQGSDKERGVVCNDDGNLMLSNPGYEGSIFTFDQPSDIYGAPLSLGSEGLMRWSVCPSAKDEALLATLLANNGTTHDARYVQNTSIRHYDSHLRLGFFIPQERFDAFDFAWRFYCKEGDVQRFYEDRQPITVVIGNRYMLSNVPQDTFVTIDARDCSSLVIKCSITEATEFRLYPEW